MIACILFGFLISITTREEELTRLERLVLYWFCILSGLEFAMRIYYSVC